MGDRKIEDCSEANRQHYVEDHKAVIRRMENTVVHCPGKDHGENTLENGDPTDLGILIIGFLEGIAQALNVELWCSNEG